MNEKHSLRIKIFGVEYVLKGESDPQYMEELASLVDQKMRELGQPGGAQTHRVAILAAFHLADELMKAKKALEAEKLRYDQAARSAASMDLRLQGVLNERDKNAVVERTLIVEEAQPGLLDEN
jgi:cell division protein ZapA